MRGVFHVAYSQKDLELFLDVTRAKFVGFSVKNNIHSLTGLPQPIHEAVKVLNQVCNYTGCFLPVLFLD